MISLIYRTRCFDLLSHNLVLQLSNRLGQPKPNFVCFDPLPSRCLYRAGG